MMANHMIYSFLMRAGKCFSDQRTRRNNIPFPPNACLYSVSMCMMAVPLGLPSSAQNGLVLVLRLSGVKKKSR